MSTMYIFKSRTKKAQEYFKTPSHPPLASPYLRTFLPPHSTPLHSTETGKKAQTYLGTCIPDETIHDDDVIEMRKHSGRMWYFEEAVSEYTRQHGYRVC